MHQNRDVEPLQLRDGVDFVQKRKDRPDAELVDAPAVRGVVMRCNALESGRRCCTGCCTACNVWTRRPNAHRTPTHSSVQPIERFTPGRPRIRHTFAHRPTPVLVLACANTNVCGDCRLRCSAPPTSEGWAVCRSRSRTVHNSRTSREHASLSRAASGFRVRISFNNFKL